MTEQPLKGFKLVTLALNAPGPAAAARLVGMGMEATKVEPPTGDPLKRLARPWYDAMIRNQAVITLDLKDDADQAKLREILADADLLLTSFRPSALNRLQLSWEDVHQRHPILCAVNIIGFPSPEEEVPGHDLNYQARLGLLRPPELPITLYADLAGAERAVGVALALLLKSARTGLGEFASVSLHEVMKSFTAPLASGLTASGGTLGGGSPFYGLYRSSDGWIALAALEPAFAQRLQSELNLKLVTCSELEDIFRTRTSAEWEAWAKERDLPLTANVSTCEQSGFPNDH